jgi:hypothetical protein
MLRTVHLGCCGCDFRRLLRPTHLLDNRLLSSLRNGLSTLSSFESIQLLENAREYARLIARSWMYFMLWLLPNLFALHWRDKSCKPKWFTGRGLSTSRYYLEVGGATISVERLQLPVTGGYAFTDYPSQVQTLPVVIDDLAKPPSISLTSNNTTVTRFWRQTIHNTPQQVTPKRESSIGESRCANEAVVAKQTPDGPSIGMSGTKAQQHNSTVKLAKPWRYAEVLLRKGLGM